MYIQLTAIRVDSYGCENNGSRVTIRKDQIAAIVSAYSYNHKMQKNEYYRGNTHVYLASGTVLPVREKLEEVEAILLAE